ncbi:Flp pilus assembly complex ATPase component TadA [Massilia antarctica]|uniref:Flp pilus assembly complex ATPase component TadA n=1 Tax=Massilia antarctica TaxID=2765360 RepID=A0AA49A5T9_9BURK|nr:ATPase, T2SS/T4P/T4SS family [Massilia antarctica]QPI47644.1 Flp pilus assembly complex ATPase component TadA [Massilia antarctica]
MLDVTAVRQLVFSDLYLGHPTLEDRFCDVPGAPANPLCASAALRDDLDLLIGVCKAALAGPRAPARCRVAHDGVDYHMTTMVTAGGQVFVLRKLAGTIRSLAELGIPNAFIPALLGRGLSGLFLVAGAAKSGKTSTACAIVKERLAAHGGVALTGESLIELPLEGSYGDGVCYQTGTGADASVAEALRRVLGSGAHIILLDEIRDQESAVAALRASIDGYLLISTMRADSATQAIGKLESLAAERLGAVHARALMADGLAGVLHQQLGASAKITLRTDMLMLKEAPSARSHLRSGQYDLLAAIARQQMAVLIAASAAIPMAQR